MLRWRVMAVWAGLLALAVGLSGCVPDDSHLDEEKDPHFQRGRNLVNGQDYAGAAEEFEMALEDNPRSAAAHFELGWLYDTKLNDSAAAIYHYQRHLQLLPDSDRAQLIQERIRGCKQDLANTEFPLPNGQNQQREIDRLTAENLALKQQLASLRLQAASRAGTAPTRATTGLLMAGFASAAKPAVLSRPRVHVVKQRETISSIAAEYGLKAGAILTANPRVEPRRLRIGQSLNLP
jgi:tetratricopeptide (TPR) repeat protein